MDGVRVVGLSGGVGQLGAVDIRPILMLIGVLTIDKDLQAEPGNLGGAGMLPERRGCIANPE